MGLSAKLQMTFEARLTGTSQLGVPEYHPKLSRTIEFLSGLGGNQADLIYSARRAIGASSNDDIDLNGVLSSGLGAAVNFAELIGLIVSSDPANVSSLTIGLGTNPFLGFLGGTTPTVKSIGPGGLFVLFSPDASGLGAIAGGSTDILRIANGSGGGANVDVVLLGRSA